MERKDVALDRAEAVDGKAGLIRPGISARGQHDPDTRPGRPRWSGPAERAARGCLEQRNQVALQPWQNDLRLRVAQAGIELEHLDTGRTDHEAGVEAAAIGCAVLAQGLYDGQQHFGDGAIDLARAKERDR